MQQIIMFLQDLIITSSFVFFLFEVQIRRIISGKNLKKIETRESNAFTYEHTYLNAERVQREYKLGMHSLRHKQSLIRFCGKEVGSVGTD